MKKREETELEEGEVSAPPPVLSSVPPAGLSARREVEPRNPMMPVAPDERIMRAPSPVSDMPRRSLHPLQLDDAWEQDEIPYYQLPSGHRGVRGVRSRGRAGIPGARGRGRGAGWPNTRPGRYRGEASSNPPPLTNEQSLPHPSAATGAEQMSLEEMVRTLVVG